MRGARSLPVELSLVLVLGFDGAPSVDQWWPGVAATLQDLQSTWSVLSRLIHVLMLVLMHNTPPDNIGEVILHNQRHCHRQSWHSVCRPTFLASNRDPGAASSYEVARAETVSDYTKAPDE